MKKYIKQKAPFILKTKTVYYIPNPELLKQRLERLFEYNTNLWMEEEYGRLHGNKVTDVFTETQIAVMEKYLETEVIELWEIVENIPPTDPTKQRSYERALKKYQDYNMHQTIRDIIDELRCGAEFKDIKDLPFIYV